MRSTSCAARWISALTLILNIYLKGSWIKLTIGLGKGRKLHDKRAAEKEKQSKKDESSDGAPSIERICPIDRVNRLEETPFVGDQQLQPSSLGAIRSPAGTPPSPTARWHRKPSLYQRCALDAQGHGITC